MTNLISYLVMLDRENSLLGTDIADEVGRWALGALQAGLGWGVTVHHCKYYHSFHQICLD